MYHGWTHKKHRINLHIVNKEANTATHIGVGKLLAKPEEADSVVRAFCW